MMVVAMASAHTQFATLISFKASAAGDSQPPGRRRSYGSQDGGAIGGLGQTLIAAAGDPKSKTQIEKQNQGKLRKENPQINGSDVLWALQRATAEKKRSTAVKRKKKTGIGSESSADEFTVEDRVDYSNVRPLCVKTEWASRLDELETRLKELEEGI